MGCPLICRVSNLPGDTMLDGDMTLNEDRNGCDMCQPQRSTTESTKPQIQKPKPYTDDKTWLQQKARSKAATIDEMILEGIHTIEEIGKALCRICPHNKPLEIQVNLVEGHIRHLQDRESWGGLVR
jgi:hypothetical protein